MTGWTPYWDDSFSPVPIARLGEMYAAGYRVWARYVSGGSSGKWFTRAEVDAWFAHGPDTGIFVLYETTTTEPVDHPELGGPHARAARAALRALGAPDSVSICAAMDSNVTAAQWEGPIAAYCRNWDAADTVPLSLYVEADAGAYLVGRHLIAGDFTPAAYGWNDPPVLYTPSNAPPSVMATQEHNGRQMAGGVVDIGHIRTTAPIWWAQPSNPGDQGVDMALTQADADLVAKTIALYPLHNDVTNTDVPLGTFLRSVNTGVNDLRTNLVPGVAAAENAEAAALAAVKAELDAAKAELDAQSAALAGLPAAVVAALPPVAGGQPGFTDAQLAQIEQAVADVLGRTTAALAVAPAATPAG